MEKKANKSEHMGQQSVEVQCVYLFVCTLTIRYFSSDRWRQQQRQSYYCCYSVYTIWVPELVCATKPFFNGNYSSSIDLNYDKREEQTVYFHFESMFLVYKICVCVIGKMLYWYYCVFFSRFSRLFVHTIDCMVDRSFEHKHAFTLLTFTNHWLST